MFLNTIRNWFADSDSQPARRNPTTSLRLESLEAREVPAFFGGLPDVAAIVQKATASAQAAVVTTQATTLGQKMANYLQQNVGKRVGGGECAHIASEALRAAGADFTRTETKGTQDYVWASNRVARLTHGNQLAGKRFQVGDIIQYQNATFSPGAGSSKLVHHTQVVASVDSAGRITKVYEQNYNYIRKVQVNAVPNLAKLTGGSVSIYRAVARVTQSGLLEFTVVNNTNASRTYTIQIGSSASTNTLTKANTETSYKTQYITFYGKVTPTLKIGNASVAIQNGAAYELYTMTSGQVGLRRM